MRLIDAVELRKRIAADPLLDIAVIYHLLMAVDDAPTEEAAPVQRWIPCSDRLPEQCDKYLVAVESEAFLGCRYVDILRYDEIGWRDGSCYVNGVSYWMSLPALPKEEGTE